MSSNPKPKPSFSAASRWRIGLSLAVRTVLVLAVAVMVNYLAGQFSHRFYLSSQTRIALSSRTLAVLHSLTNQVTLTLYYDTHDQNNFYPTLVALARAYQAENDRITVRTVDYVANPGEAEKVKEEYNLPSAAGSPGAPPSKDLIIFASGSRHDVVPGAAIVGKKTMQIGPDDPNYDPRDKRLQFLQKPTTFNGEVMFTAKLLALEHAQPLKTYFLQGHGETSLADTTDNGFQKFGLALVQNDMTMDNLELLGTTEVPMDCSLLVIAAPIKPLDPSELQKISRYLDQGGRLLALFNYASLRQPTGLEPILQRWGVTVASDYVKDQQSIGDQVVVVRNFNQKSFLNPLSQLALEMVLPRPILKTTPVNPPANAPQVDELAFSSDNATLAGDELAAPRRYSLITAVEQKPAAGVAKPRGNTRILVAGDSLFLDNQLLDAAANRDFLNYAVNWLVNRQELLTGITPRPVTEYRLVLTQPERKKLNWLLLGALPGGILVFGWLVWLVRRK